MLGLVFECVDKIFCDLYIIKGFFDLFDIKFLICLVYVVEDLFDSVRFNEVIYSDDIGDLLFEVLD